MKTRILFYTRLLLSLLLIGYLVYSVDTDLIFRPIAPLGWIYLLLMFLWVNLDRILMAYKWNILLKAKGIDLSFSEVIRSYYIGTFWGIFLPSSVGGDMVRAYKVSAQTKNGKDIFSSILLERVLGVFSTFLMGMISVSLFVTLVSSSNWIVAPGIVFSFLFFLGLLFFSFNNRWIQYLDQWFTFHNQRWIGKVLQVYRSYQDYQNHRGAMVIFLLWSLFEQCIPIICVFLMALTVGLKVPFWSFFIFIPLIMALSKIPISLDGFGVREGLYVYFFSMVGVANSDAFLLGFLSHIVGIVSVLPGFFYYSFFSPSTVARSSLSIKG